MGWKITYIHIATHIHPTIALSSLVKDIKLACSSQIKEQQLFSKFNGWQEGYGSFTYSMKDKDRSIVYIKNQQKYHKKVSFREEYKSLLKEHNIEFDEKYML